jgi:hypothetical protein
MTLGSICDSDSRGRVPSPMYVRFSRSQSIHSRAARLACLRSSYARSRSSVYSFNLCAYAFMAPKRKEGVEDDGNPKKKAQTELPTFDPRWKALKPSMLYLGEELKPCEKIAAFDMDGTLVEWKPGAPPFSLDPNTWEWWNKTVPSKLKVRNNLVGSDVHLTTNQSVCTRTMTSPMRAVWMQREALVKVTFLTCFIQCCCKRSGDMQTADQLQCQSQQPYTQIQPADL